MRHYIICKEGTCNCDSAFVHVPASLSGHTPSCSLDVWIQVDCLFLLFCLFCSFSPTGLKADSQDVILYSLLSLSSFLSPLSSNILPYHSPFFVVVSIAVSIVSEIIPKYIPIKFFAYIPKLIRHHSESSNAAFVKVNLFGRYLPYFIVTSEPWT